MSELYQLPDGWEWRELKTVCTFINGRAYKQAELLSDGKYPVLRVGNFFTNNSWYYSDLELPRDKYCDQGDLLYAWSASFGPKIWDGVKSIFHYHIWKIEPDYSAVTKLYLYWLLYWDVNQIKVDFGSGTTMIHITKGAIESRKVPLPLITEQKRIVQKLDALFERIDKAIALLQKNIAAADNFMNSVLNDVFSDLEQNYSKCSVDEICTKITDGTHSTPSYIDSGIPFLSVKDISKGVINFSNTRFISLEEHKLLSKRCNVEKNDLLYTKVGTTGVAKVVDVDNEFSIFVSIALLKPKHDIVYNMFFQYMLNSPNCYSQSQELTRGVANRNLVLKDIKGIIFPIPPYEVQQNIVIYLDQVFAKIEQVKSAQQQKMQNLLDLKSSILDQAFHGKL